MPVLTGPGGVLDPGHATLILPVGQAPGALPAITVTPATPTFAVGASGAFATLSAVPAGATRTISGDGRVVLGAGGGTLVVGLTAATAGTSVPVTITDAKAGAASVTLVLSIPVTAAVAATPLGIISSVINPGADGFGPGIYGPTTIYANSNGGSGSVTGSWFARLETKGPQVWTLSDLTANCYASGVNGAFLNNYLQVPVGTHALTWTVTDGQTTKTLAFTVIGSADAVNVGSNFVLDASAIRGPGMYGSALGNQTPPAWHFGGAYNSFGRAGAVNDPHGFVQIDGDGFDGLATTLTGSATTPHYGAYTGATLVLPSVPAFSQPFSYWIAQEQPAAMRFDMPLAYDTALAGDVLGVLHASSDAGILTLTIISSGQPLTLAPDGTVRFQAAPVANPAISVVFRVTSNNGVTTDFSTTYVIGVGVTLPSSNFASTLRADLNNAMGTDGNPGPVTVGTISISGMTAPIISVMAVNERPIEHPLPAAPTPTFFFIMRAGNPLLADVFSCLTGQEWIATTAATGWT